MTDNDKQKQKIVTDEDWKTQARQEKEKLDQPEEKPAVEPDAHAGPMPPPNFLTLINSIVVQIMFCLGKLADHKDQKPKINLELAKHHIDMLQVLEDKTKGNLTDEETKTLAMALHEMRMQYVQLAQV